jgi:hypothetical protein
LHPLRRFITAPSIAADVSHTSLSTRPLNHFPKRKHKRTKSLVPTVKKQCNCSGLVSSNDHQLLVKFELNFRLISIARLNVLLRLHLQPICGVVFPEPVDVFQSTKPSFVDSFTLICIQRLSKLDLATRRCPRRDNRYTRGLCILVLSY